METGWLRPSDTVDQPDMQQFPPPWGSWAQGLVALDPMWRVSLHVSCAPEEPVTPVAVQLILRVFSWESPWSSDLLSRKPRDFLTAACHANNTPVKVPLCMAICPPGPPF